MPGGGGTGDAFVLGLNHLQMVKLQLWAGQSCLCRSDWSTEFLINGNL